MSMARNADSAVGLLRRLEAILESEDGRDWLPGIKITRQTGEHLIAAGDSSRALVKMGAIYRGMHSDPGGIDDFFIWRDTPTDRMVANRELERIKGELWKILGFPPEA